MLFMYDLKPLTDLGLFELRTFWEKLKLESKRDCQQMHTLSKDIVEYAKEGVWRLCIAVIETKSSKIVIKVPQSWSKA